jgi:hypothetical protein
MQRRLAVLVAAVALAGCGGGSDGETVFEPEAVAEADAFVRAFVADGDPAAARRLAVGAAARNLDLWHIHFVRDGIRTVEGPGNQLANCVKPFPVFARRRTGDCIVYRLRGLRPIEGSDRTLVTTARFRVWLTEWEGTWRVAEFDYSPRLEAR